MQSDELAIDHLNGLRLSYNSKDVIDNKVQLKQKHTSKNEKDDSNGYLQQRIRKHKKSKNKIKKAMNRKANAEYHIRDGSCTEGRSNGEYTEESKHDDDDDVPHRRLKIITTPVGERRRGSNRRKSHTPGVVTKIPKLLQKALGSRDQSEEDNGKLPIEHEDGVEDGLDTESYLKQISESKRESNVSLTEKECEGRKEENLDGESKTELINHDNKSTRLDFVWKMHLRFRSLGIMTNGLVAGLALSQCIFIFTFSNKNLKDDYSELAILFQSIYYVLLTISTVSVLDSFFSLDSDWVGFLNHLIAKPLRAITLISYTLSLIFSISLAQLDDSISMERISSKKLDTWKALNMFRVITSIIGWVSVSFSPLDDVTALCIKEKKAKEIESLKFTARGDVKLAPVVTCDQEM